MSKFKLKVGDLVKLNPTLKKDVYSDYNDVGIIVKKHELNKRYKLMFFHIVWFGANKNNKWMRDFSCDTSENILIKLNKS